MIEEKQEYQIEVTAENFIQVRRADIVLKDGKEIARNYHRQAFSPGDDISSQDQKVKDIANVIWTPEIIAAYKKSL